MSLEIYPSDFSTRYEIRHAISAIMTVYYNDIGKITLVAPVNDYNITALKNGNLLYDTDKDVTYVLVNSKIDTDNSRITSNGYTANWYLNKRCISAKYQMKNIETVVYDIVNQNMRGLTRISTASPEGFTEKTDSGFAEAVEITDNGAEKTINQWHLYNLGDECTSVTGGWISSGSYQDQPLAEPIRNEDNIQCNGKGGYKVGVITTKATPFSGFSKLYAEVIVSLYDSEFDSSLCLSICDKDTRNEIAHVSAGPVSASLKTITLSIGSTIDSACVLAYAPSTPSAQGKIYRIWLEV